MREQLRAIRDGLLKLEWSVKPTDNPEQSTRGDKCPACGGYKRNHHGSSEPPFPREKHVTGPDCWLRNAIIWIDDYLTEEAPMPNRRLSTALEKCIAFIKMANQIDIGIQAHRDSHPTPLFISSNEGFQAIGIKAEIEVEELFDEIDSLIEQRGLLNKDKAGYEARADILKKENIRLTTSEENLAEGLTQAMGYIEGHEHRNEEFFTANTNVARAALKRYKKGSFQHRHERHESILSGMRAREEEILT